MRKDLLNIRSGTKSVCRVLLKAFLNEIFALCGHGNSVFLGVREEYWFSFDEFVHLVVVRVARVEGREADDHFISQNS